MNESRSLRLDSFTGSEDIPIAIRTRALLWIAFAILVAAGVEFVASRFIQAWGWPPAQARVATCLAILLAWTLFRVLGLDARSRRRRRLLGCSEEDLDRLQGPEFEEWVALVLETAGWSIRRNRKGGDFGVDLVAARAGRLVGIEVKRRSDRIANAVVRSVVAGCQYYGCDVAAVVTQSTFTRQAAEQAAGSEVPVILIGRYDLHRLAVLLAGAP